MKAKPNETLLLLAGLAGFAAVVGHTLSQSIDNAMTEDRLRQERHQALCGNCSGWKSATHSSPSFLSGLVTGEKTEQEMKEDRERLVREMASCAILDTRTGKPIHPAIKEYLVEHNPPRPHFHGAGDCVVTWDSAAKRYVDGGTPVPVASAPAALPAPVQAQAVEVAPQAPAAAPTFAAPVASIAPTPVAAPAKPIQPQLTARDRQLLKQSNKALDAALKGL